jgi:microcystin-dependent protein
MGDGGAEGDAVGSVQLAATGPPNLTNPATANPFTVTATAWTDKFESNWAWGWERGLWTDDSATVSVTGSGGDDETRPVNISVDHYVLRVGEGDADIFPVGALIAYGGDAQPPPKDQWLLCDGTLLDSSTDPQYTDLQHAIGSANGGNGGDQFYVPDYQGYFLRGADHSTGRDPDASKRAAAKPGGQTGDGVGSLQQWATAPPHVEMTIIVPHLPTDDNENTLNSTGAGDTVSFADPVTVQVAGGDHETRPANTYVLFYIKYATAVSSLGV